MAYIKSCEARGDAWHAGVAMLLARLYLDLSESTDTVAELRQRVEQDEPLLDKYRQSLIQYAMEARELRRERDEIARHAASLCERWKFSDSDDDAAAIRTLTKQQDAPTERDGA